MNRRITSSGIVCSAFAALAVCNSALAAASGQITTTIYVGRHFEVRDHDQPTKYVFNGATRVASITGSLSANTRIQRLRLYPGWNLCSLAVTASNALQQLNSLSASGGEGQAEVVRSAFKWNPPTQGWLPVATNDTLAAGTVLWLKTKTNAVISVEGNYSDPTTQQIQAGGVYITSAGLEAWTPSFPPTLSVWFFDAEIDQWREQLVGDLAFISNLPPTLAPAQSIYIQTPTAGSLEIPDPTLRIRYYHQDHLGSSSVITDAAGALVEETAFYPFGAARIEFKPRQAHESYEFTQKERDHESGLQYFETRYLSSLLSRFATADPKYANMDTLSAEDLASFLANPQEIGLYCYVRNNPLKFTDPTGLEAGGENEESHGTLEKVETVNTGFGMMSEIMEKTLELAGEGEQFGKVLGAVAKPTAVIGVGIKGYEFVKHPSSETGFNFGWAGEKVALGVVAWPVGLIAEGLDLVGYGPEAINKATEQSIRANRAAAAYCRTATLFSRTAELTYKAGVAMAQKRIPEINAKVEFIEKGAAEIKQRNARELARINQKIRQTERATQRLRAEERGFKARARKANEEAGQ